MERFIVSNEPKTMKRKDYFVVTKWYLNNKDYACHGMGSSDALYDFTYTYINGEHKNKNFDDIAEEVKSSKRKIVFYYKQLGIYIYKEYININLSVLEVLEGGVEIPKKYKDYIIKDVTSEEVFNDNFLAVKK